VRGRSAAERERQGARDRSGRYAEFNPCRRCGRSAGYDYSSGPWVDQDDPDGFLWNDEALCLCESCAAYMIARASEPGALRAEVMGGRWGKFPQGRA
jgi:hypothetical protein